MTLKNQAIPEEDVSPPVKFVSSKTFQEMQKCEEIEKILSEPEVDLWRLRNLCLTEGGLINDDLRKKAWPKLLGLDSSRFAFGCSAAGETICNDTKIVKGELSSSISKCINVIEPSVLGSKGSNKLILAQSVDSDQIGRDTSRCTWHLLTGSQRSRKRQMQNKHKKKIRALLKRKQNRLGNFINLSLIRSYEDVDNDNDRLRYYQGFHDVSCIFLSALGGTISSPCNDSSTFALTAPSQIVAATNIARVMGMELPCQALLTVSYSHFRDSMQCNFKRLTQAMRLTIMPMIDIFDPEVHDYLEECGMEPFFSLSWIITWFSHDVRDTALVKRLFDVFIASHPLMPLYLSIAMVLHPINRMEVLNAECDFGIMHKTLSELPRNSCSVGWRFVGNSLQGGYISGEDDVDDEKEDAVSVDGMDDDRDDGSNAPSLASSSLMSERESVRVSFEELIDLAIHLMRRIPPRQLIPLARGYHSPETMKSLLEDAALISLFQNPPSWALADTAPSDYVLKKKSKDKLKRSTSTESFCSDGINSKTIKTSRSLNAIVAAGIGPYGDGEEMKKKKMRKLYRIISITVGIVAIVFGTMHRRDRNVIKPTLIMNGKILEKSSDVNIDIDIDIVTTSSEKQNINRVDDAGDDIVKHSSSKKIIVDEKVDVGVMVEEVITDATDKIDISTDSFETHSETNILGKTVKARPNYVEAAINIDQHEARNTQTKGSLQEMDENSKSTSSLELRRKSHPLHALQNFVHNSIPILFSDTEGNKINPVKSIKQFFEETKSILSSSFESGKTFHPPHALQNFVHNTIPILFSDTEGNKINPVKSIKEFFEETKSILSSDAEDIMFIG